MNKRDFDQLVASVKQAGAIKRGKMKPGRRVQMNTADIRMIRKKPALCATSARKRHQQQ